MIKSDSFQQYASDQPNIAVLRFAYSWLPGLIIQCIISKLMIK
jgi:hypothetical protein